MHGGSPCCPPPPWQCSSSSPISPGTHSATGSATGDGNDTTSGAGMLIVIVKRLLAGLLVLLALIAAVFILRQLTPVDPARAIVGFNAPAPAVAAERVKLGLNDPLWVQYVHYVEQVAAGHFGESAVSRQPILTNLATYLPATLELVVVAFVIALLLGSFFGVATAQGWRGGHPLRVISIVASSRPLVPTRA